MNFNIPIGKVAKEKKQKSFCGAKYYNKWHLHLRWDNFTRFRVRALSLANEKPRKKIKANIVPALHLSDKGFFLSSSVSFKDPTPFNDALAI